MPSDGSDSGGHFNCLQFSLALVNYCATENSLRVRQELWQPMSFVTLHIIRAFGAL